MMISTVTTSTVSVLTSAQLTEFLAVIAIMVLLALLVQKEVAIAASIERLPYINKVQSICVVPLLFTFLFIIFFKFTAALY
jgi:uncharacterized RDD family membrane protein YckC